MNFMRIVHLYQHPQYISSVAEWIYNEFWMDKPGFSPAFFENELKKAAKPDNLPISFLALFDDIPVGTVNFIENDDEDRKHLYPWLAALYVLPEYRKAGVGSALVGKVKAQAQLMGIKEFFLGTDNPKFYEKLGAEFFEQARSDLVIMRIKLN